MDGRDISKNELLKKLKGLLGLLDVIPDAVFEIDADGTVTFVNKVGLQKLGVASRDLARGINLFDCFDDLRIDHSIKTPHEVECAIVPKEGSCVPAMVLIVPVFQDDKLAGYWAVARDISELKRIEKEWQSLIAGLQKTDANIKALSGLLPICAHCKKIRDASGKWHSFENYIRKHSEVEFSHSLCPDCIASLYPDLFERQSELGFEE